MLEIIPTEQVIQTVDLQYRYITIAGTIQNESFECKPLKKPRQQRQATNKLKAHHSKFVTDSQPLTAP